MILGVVLTLDGPVSRELEGALAKEPRVEVGVAAAHKLPVVLDVLERGADEVLLDWLRGLPGVLAADVVYADLEEPEAASTPASGG